MKVATFHAPDGIPESLSLTAERSIDARLLEAIRLLALSFSRATASESPRAELARLVDALHDFNSRN